MLARDRGPVPRGVLGNHAERARFDCLAHELLVPFAILEDRHGDVRRQSHARARRGTAAGKVGQFIDRFMGAYTPRFLHAVHRLHVPREHVARLCQPFGLSETDGRHERACFREREQHRAARLALKMRVGDEAEEDVLEARGLDF